MFTILIIHYLSFSIKIEKLLTIIIFFYTMSYYTEIIPEEEMKRICKEETEKELLKLGVELYKKNEKQKEENYLGEIESLFQSYNENFDVREFLVDFETLTEEQKKLKLFRLLQHNSILTKYIQKNKEKTAILHKQIEELKEDTEYHENEENRYMTELEEVEKRFDEYKKYSVKKINTLNENLILKNKKIKKMRNFTIIMVGLYIVLLTMIIQTII